MKYLIIEFLIHRPSSVFMSFQNNFSEASDNRFVLIENPWYSDMKIFLLIHSKEQTEAPGINNKNQLKLQMYKRVGRSDKLFMGFHCLIRNPIINRLLIIREYKYGVLKWGAPA